MDLPHYKQILSGLSIFSGLTESEFADIAKLFRVIQLKPEELLCEEGSPGSCFFIIEIGSLEILRSTQQGDNQAIAQVQGPSVVGEMALLDGSKRSATIRALSEVTLYQIECADFQVLRNNWNSAAFKIIRNIGLTLCARLRDTNERISHFFSHPEQSLHQMKKRQEELWEQRIRERGGLV